MLKLKGLPFKKKKISCATHPTRSWSVYPALAYLCLTNLLRLRHRLNFRQWWHLSPQRLCQHEGFLLWCLLLCVIMWFQRIQRKWYFLHKPCAYRPRLFRCGGWSSWGMRVFTWGLTSSPEVGRWQEGLWHGLFFLVFIFFSLPFVSDRAFCYKVTFTWCRINIFSWSWNDWNRIRVHTDISCPCVCGVRLPMWLLHLTSKLLIDFGCYFSRFSPWWRVMKYNIFDRRRRSVHSTNNSTLPLMFYLYCFYYWKQ